MLSGSLSSVLGSRLMSPGVPSARVWTSESSVRVASAGVVCTAREWTGESSVRVARAGVVCTAREWTSESDSADDAVAEDDITEYILEPVCNGNSDTADNDNEPLFGRSSPFRQVPKLYAKPRRSDRKFFTNSVSETERVRNCHNFSHLKAQELKLKVNAAKDALTYAQECFRAKMKREDEAHQQKLRLEEESHQQKIRHAEDLHRLNVEKMRKDLGLVLREDIDSNQTSQGETCDENILQYDTPMLEN
uniref:Uncharacterized protein n=1 Tax=Timema douglasi TaxID=61478 RepID=A0A7R8VGJ0_TIMDO|nr:unnamed protein product [Timema douglasi]